MGGDWVPSVRHKQVQGALFHGNLYIVTLL